MNPHPLNPLTKYEEDICIWGGVIGVGLSVTSLIQHIAVARFFWLTYMMLGFYFIIIIAFILVAIRHVAGSVMIIVSAALSMVNEIILKNHKVFSMIVLLLALYSVVLAVYLFNEKIPARLKEKRRLELEEEERWRGKI